MTNQPLNAASLRGAVDLSSLKKPQGGAGANRSAPGVGATPGVSGTTGSAPRSNGGSFGPDGLVVDVTADNFQTLLQRSMQYPVIIAIWAASQPASRTPVDVLARAVEAKEGRVLLGVADLDVAPEIGQVFAQLSQQAQAQMPGGQILAAAFIQGQPLPIPPVVEDDMANEVLDQITQIAVQNGMTGRVEYDASQPASGEAGGEEAREEDVLPALHQRAYDAIEKGDLDGAAAAFEQALADDPSDDEARLALGQVKLMKRTQGVDLQQAREKAAQNPQDVDAQMIVADLDLLGGHVEDAFSRLIDVVKATRDEERTKAREHLVELFDVVGVSDPRVKKARTALMSALY